MKQLKFTFLLTVLMSMVGEKTFAYDAKINGIYYSLQNSSSGKTAYVTYQEAITTDDESSIPEGYDYEDDNGTYKYYTSDYSGSITIPETVTYNGVTYNVTYILSHAFNNCSATSITIPKTITYIGRLVFRGFTGALIIHSSCFSGVAYDEEGDSYVYSPYAYGDFNSVTIGNEITNLFEFESYGGGNGVFSNCTNLSSVTLSSLTKIPGSTFWGCTNLSAVSVPSSVMEIGDYAFYGCSNLAAIDINATSLTSIGYNAFKGCNNLKIVNLNSISNWLNCNLSDEYSSPFCNEADLYVADQEKTSLSFPVISSVIPAYAFFGCSNITIVTIPALVSNIGTGAFSGCSSLTAIDVNSSNSNFCAEDGVLYNSDKTELISFPSAKSGDYIVPSTVSSVKESAFYNAKDLTSIILPSSLASIGRRAFYNCSGLTSITLPSSLTSIGFYAFSGCSTLGTVNIVFSDISKISEDKISYGELPSSATWNYYINEDLITEVYVPSSITRIGNNAFYNANGLTSITLPSSLTSIGSSAFYNCSGLTSLTIPNSVMTIGNYAFSGCSGLTSITLPSSLTSIGDYAFLRCSCLTSVTAEMETPIRIRYGDTFMNRKNATLYVPKGCKAAYEAADYWKEFKEIIEVGNIESAVQFLDKDGNVIEDGTVINITEGEEDVFGDIMFPTGLYVENISGEDIYVGLSLNVRSLPNGSFQIAFPVNCMNFTREGSYKTPEGLLEVEAKKSLMAVWMPDEYGFGTCTVDLQINAYIYNSVTNQYVLDKEGPIVTVNMIYSDGGAPHPSTNILSAKSPTFLTGNASALTLGLTNEDEIIMTEFYMQLPEGITIEEDEDGYPLVTLNSERDNNHVLEVSRNSNGDYHFLCYSSKNNAFKGNEGELFSMNLICAEGVTAGTYTATVKDIIMSDVYRNELTQSDFTFDITVLDVAMGDANGDGRINGMDIVEMVDYIMERPSNSFVFAAADLTGDGKVNGMDLVELVSLVMAQGATQAAPPSALPRREGTLQTEKLDMGTLALKRNEDGGVMLGVEDPDEFILAQMVVEVSDGTLTDVTTDNAHVAAWTPIGENRYSVLAYSMRNRLFTTNDCLLTFLGCEGNVTVKDVMLVDADREARFFADVTYNGTTGIAPTPNPSPKGRESIYDLSGRKLETRNMELGTSPKGVYIVNGKKVVVK